MHSRQQKTLSHDVQKGFLLIHPDSGESSYDTPYLTQSVS